MGKRVENVAISIFRPVNQSGPPPLARKRYARHRVPRQGTIKISVNRCWNSLEKSLTDRFRILDLRGSEIVISSLPPCRGREDDFCDVCSEIVDTKGSSSSTEEAKTSGEGLRRKSIAAFQLICLTWLTPFQTGT